MATLFIVAARMYGYTQNLPPIILYPELFWNILFLAGAVWGLVLAFKDRQWYLFWSVLLVCVYFTTGTLAVKTAAMDTHERSMLVPFMAVSFTYAALQLWQKWQLGRAQKLPLDKIGTSVL